jgi:hypothetical protein
VAERALEGARAWASSPANFDTLETVYSPYTYDDQGFTVEVEAGAAVPVASPCTQLEEVFPAPERRMMTASFKPIQIRVSQGAQTLTLDSLLGDPPRTPRDPNPVVIGGVVPVAPVHKDGTVDLTASLVDTAGQPIPDIFFGWSLVAVTGTGILEGTDRQGRQQTFRHRMMRQDGSLSFSPGAGPAGTDPSECKVNAYTTYMGLDYSGDSSAILLDP